VPGRVRNRDRSGRFRTPRKTRGRLEVPKGAVARFVFRYRRGETDIVEVHAQDGTGETRMTDLGFLEEHGKRLVEYLQSWHATGSWR
jgi:hypothetical protein